MLIVLDLEIELERNSNNKPKRLHNTKTGETYFELTYDEKDAEVIRYEDIEGNIYDSTLMDFPFRLKHGLWDIYIPEKEFQLHQFEKNGPVPRKKVLDSVKFSRDELYLRQNIKQSSPWGEHQFIICEGKIYRITQIYLTERNSLICRVFWPLPVKALCRYTFQQ